MARPAKGQVVVNHGKRGTTYAARFRAYGQRHYVTFGGSVTTEDQAQQELENILADVRRGIWRPPTAPVVTVPTEAVGFHRFASDWFATRNAEGLARKTIVDLRWSLDHLLPYFAQHELAAITPQEVDRYKVAKVVERDAIEKRRAAAVAKGEKFTERPLSNNSINHILRHLSQILETAAEYGLVDSNAASGKRRRLKAAKPARPWVEPEQLPALLDGATGTGRVLLGILAGAGLRIGEALALKWSNVDLGTGTIHVLASKTDAGVREVHLSPALREELTLARADANPAPGDYVIATATGSKHNPSNLRRDVLAPAVKAANTTLEAQGIAPIGRVTFHGLRRSYASLRCACGDDVRYTADQLGHEDPRFTLTVYAKATKRRDRLTGAHLKAYDRAIDWAAMGSKDVLTVPVLAVEATETA